MELTLPEVDGEAWRATLTVRLPRPLPVAFLRSGRHVDDLGDLVLDNAPIEIRSSDLPALRARIGTDAVRGLLLDELCENPGSEVRSGEIRLVRTEGALDVESLVARGLELARALSG